MNQFLMGLVKGMEYFFYSHLMITFAIYLYVIWNQRLHLIRLKRNHLSFDEINFSKFRPPKVTFIVPAFNASERILETIDSILKQGYPNQEILIINDGSTDQTLRILMAAYSLDISHSDLAPPVLSKTTIHNCYRSNKHRNLAVICKTHTGKSDSLNVGIDQSTGTYLCCIDADSTILPNATEKLISHFINEPNLIALGGMVAPEDAISTTSHQSNKPKKQKLLVKIQIIEYLRSFTAWRNGLSYLNGLLLVSGAFTVFKKTALINVGGFSAETQSEDLDIILTLHDYYLKNNLPYFIWNIEDVICWTKVPETVKALRHQRIRWMRGALECLAKHKNLLFTNKSFL